MKTQNEILTTLFTLISASPISGLNGGIYKNTRPSDSTLEDCVISLISGTTGKFVQNGAMYVKIFYSDILNGSTYYEDNVKGSTLETLLINLSAILLSQDSIIFDILSRETMIEKVDHVDIKEHFVTLKMNFKILN